MKEKNGHGVGLEGVAKVSCKEVAETRRLKERSDGGCHARECRRWVDCARHGQSHQSEQASGSYLHQIYVIASGCNAPSFRDSRCSVLTAAWVLVIVKHSLSQPSSQIHLCDTCDF